MENLTHTVESNDDLGSHLVKRETVINLISFKVIISLNCYYSRTRLCRRPRGLPKSIEITDDRDKRKPIWRQYINMCLKIHYVHDVR